MERSNYHAMMCDGTQESILGILVHYSERRKVIDVAKTINSSAFANRRIGRYVEAIQDLANKGLPFDLMALTDHLTTEDEEQNSHDFSYIAEVSKNTASDLNLESYVNTLYQYKAARDAIDRIHMLADAVNQSSKPDEVLEAVSGRLDSLISVCSVVDDTKGMLITGSDGFDYKVDWIIKGWIPRSGFGMIYAPPESFKSFQTLDWAACVAAGKPWSGNKVSQGAVLYVAGEGQVGLGGRVRAWEIVNKQEASELYRMTKGVALDEVGGRRVLLSACEQIKKQSGAYPAMIVIDTVNRCFGSGDENSTKDMTTFVSSLDYVKEQTGATILCVHHTGKDVDKGARGSSVLSGACDFEYRMKRNALPLSYVLSSSKAKDFERPASLSIQLRIVETGAIDDDGEARTSLARANDAKPATDEEQSVGGGIAAAIISIVRRNGGNAQAFVVERVIKSLGMPNTESSKSAVRREIGKLIDDGSIIKNGNAISMPFDRADFDSKEF